ncbi:MAG: hypothetical protein ACMUIU_03435 [bacterium]
MEIKADDDKEKENLAQYIIKAPISQEKLVDFGATRWYSYGTFQLLISPGLPLGYSTPPALQREQDFLLIRFHFKLIRLRVIF